MQNSPQPPPDVRQFTIDTAAVALCDDTTDIADRGIPADAWEDAVATVTALADRGLLAWIQPDDDGVARPWSPDARQAWEYGVETPWGTEWGASVGPSHRYAYTEQNVHHLASGRPVWRRLRTSRPDTFSTPERYPNPKARTS